MRRADLERSVNTASSGGAVTLQMVAAEAGVSPSTVSRILNGTARVKESKVRAVEAAISKLRFTPDPVARSLARGRSMSVGVVTQSLGSPFYGEVLSAIEERLIRANYAALFISGHYREADERRSVDHLLARRVEGIILLNSCLPEQELVNLARGAPLILTGRAVTAARIHCLDVDSTAGARLATDYLIDQGHRRIAHLAGPADHADALQRLAGYRKALSAARIPFAKELVVDGDYTAAGGMRGIDALLDSRQEFTAVFAANDETAYGAMLALHRRGLSVPKQVSVIGYDDLPASRFTIPPLTSVHRATAELGERAAEAIIELIEGRTVTRSDTPSTLAVRESTRSLRR